MLIDTEKFVFTFGKHKGDTYDEVKNDDPQYLLWCHDEIEWFELPCDEIDDIYDIIYEQGDYADMWHPGHPSNYGDK